MPSTSSSNSPFFFSQQMLPGSLLENGSPWDAMEDRLGRDDHGSLITTDLTIASKNQFPVEYRLLQTFRHVFLTLHSYHCYHTPPSPLNNLHRNRCIRISIRVWRLADDTPLPPVGCLVCMIGKPTSEEDRMHQAEMSAPV